MGSGGSKAEATGANTASGFWLFYFEHWALRAHIWSCFLFVLTITLTFCLWCDDRCSLLFSCRYYRWWTCDKNRHWLAPSKKVSSCLPEWSYAMKPNIPLVFLTENWMIITKSCRKNPLVVDTSLRYRCIEQVDNSIMQISTALVDAPSKSSQLRLGSCTDTLNRYTHVGVPGAGS